jgi:hypothetical protein
MAVPHLITSLRIPVALLERLRVVAAAESRSVNNLMIVLLGEAVGIHEKRLGLTTGAQQQRPGPQLA